AAAAPRDQRARLLLRQAADRGDALRARDLRDGVSLRDRPGGAQARLGRRPDRLCVDDGCAALPLRDPARRDGRRRDLPLQDLPGGEGAPDLRGALAPRARAAGGRGIRAPVSMSRAASDAARAATRAHYDRYPFGFDHEEILAEQLERRLLGEAIRAT